MRLIDAGELKERFCEENCGKNRCVDHMDKCAWILSVEESKIAFDVDKVVESLMNRFHVVSNDEAKNEEHIFKDVVDYITEQIDKVVNEDDEKENN